MLKEGRGAPGNSDEAVSWFVKALAGGQAAAVQNIMEFAQAGNLEAQHQIGRLYFKGKNLPLDDREAVRWWRKAAPRGHVMAQFDLAYMIAEGQGAVRDPGQAAVWYAKAAASGFSQAVPLLRNLAQRGNANAQYLYGLHLVNGGAAPDREEPRDLINAVIQWFQALSADPAHEGGQWLRKSAAQGHAGARSLLAKLKLAE